MRRLEFYIILTADGMYADPDGGLDHYDPAEDEHRYANGLTRDAGDIVMGRIMYDVMEYWDTLDLDDPAVPDVEREYAEAWRSTPKHVLSRGRPVLRGNADLVEGDAVEAVRRLKDGDGAPIGLGGGAELLATFTKAGLIDTYRFLIIPTVLGDGKAMFGGARRAAPSAIDRDTDVLGRERPAGVRTGRVATTPGLLTTTGPRPTLADHPGHFQWGERVILGRAARAIVAVAIAVQLVGGLAPAALAAGAGQVRRRPRARLLGIDPEGRRDAQPVRERRSSASPHRVDETSADLVAGDTTFSIVQFASKARDYPGCVDLQRARQPGDRRQARPTACAPWRRPTARASTRPSDEAIGIDTNYVAAMEQAAKHLPADAERPVMILFTDGKHDVKGVPLSQVQVAQGPAVRQADAVRAAARSGWAWRPRTGRRSRPGLNRLRIIQDMPACVSGATFDWPQVVFESPDQAGNAVGVALQDATCTFTVAPQPPPRRVRHRPCRAPSGRSGSEPTMARST